MPKRSSPTSRRSTKSAANRAPAGATRAQVVWISFLGAMTAVGGLLLMVDGRPQARADGLSLSPLAAATTINNTPEGDPTTQTRVPLDRARWQSIVIHHSGSLVGTPVSIAKDHEARKIRGLGHHFIIGNGSGMDDGQVHIGFRWLDQLPGAHAVGPDGDWNNQHAISICLVGDGNRQSFTPGQVQQLRTLVESLRRQLGIPAEQVRLHSDIAPDVSDPGKFFPDHVIRGLSNP